MDLLSMLAGFGLAFLVILVSILIGIIVTRESKSNQNVFSPYAVCACIRCGHYFKPIESIVYCDECSELDKED